MNRDAIQAEALARATTGQSMANYAAILNGFTAKGIPASEIHPRVNVLTFNAWKALGRSVKKGEHGVKVTTFVECQGRADESGERSTFRRPKVTTVFHVSQTEPTSEREARLAARVPRGWAIAETATA